MISHDNRSFLLPKRSVHEVATGNPTAIYFEVIIIILPTIPFGNRASPRLDEVQWRLMYPRIVSSHTIVAPKTVLPTLCIKTRCWSVLRWNRVLQWHINTSTIPSLTAQKLLLTRKLLHSRRCSYRSYIHEFKVLSIRCLCETAF